MKTRTRRGVEEALCNTCGKWVAVNESNWYWRDGGERLYAHIPCEIRRTSKVERERRAKKRGAKKGRGRKASAGTKQSRGARRK